MKSQQNHPKQFSFEFFPPKTDKGAENLRQVRDELATLNPKYASVTFGAGGSTHAGTVETVREMMAAGLDTAPHLSCIGSSEEDIRALLNGYIEMGVKRIVALRGDLPSGMGMGGAGAFNHANELVEFIRSETGDHFHIEVAAYPEFHPQATSASADLDNFAHKVKAGANAAITQYFYNLDAYLHFVDECEKREITIPIVPGIMPITNIKQLARFSEMCGADIPRWLRLRLESYGDDMESLRAYGLEITAELCRRLLEAGAPGLHFYSMNRVEPVKTIWQQLDLSND
ncbi:methylenetetrahydrofolate reductase [NAD(P)H] [Solemya pervernicosa gill symbiont]|uniref:Methylenetetrahydrofolate reductase n=2 Tax=Gammaproteobacteria incertae sedis TaxID=118884 RepID=A0A1T2LAE5_9GAMM|nr:methylenetetrahydrofolate reductase [NAD(P)H] [Candidatus Reidiella endopervernicosa]OOZ41916.1 methylenetetrahydrofolate reductase [NAD(P)H] [Solemya pervernicosa gill symbiont]QKQ24878.1 methylenetetrahydrofolate reductase [NAD(P)H] [Candidatus Reidiella endopervernicosa]